VAEIPNGYSYGSDDLALLLIKRTYNELTDRESVVIRAFLEARGRLYERYEFSVRVGTGIAPDPSHLPGVQANTARSSKKRIDILLWQGDQPTIVEAKERISPAVLGQLLTYRHLLLEDRPGIKKPFLIAIGRYSDDDTIRVLQTGGVDVYTYTPDDGS